MSGRALIAAVGQPWMRDLAFGSHVVARLREGRLPPTVDVLDLSFGAIAATQILEDGKYDHAVFITARAAGRARGAVYERSASPASSGVDEVHARIGDAVMGCIDLEHLIVLAHARRVLPADTTILEVEPEDDGWGSDLTATNAALVERAAALALAHVTDE